MVSQLLVDQNTSLRKMTERMKAISAQTSCKKDSIPKGEQRVYQSLKPTHKVITQARCDLNPATPTAGGKCACEALSDEQSVQG